MSYLLLDPSVSLSANAKIFFRSTARLKGTPFQGYLQDKFL